MGGVPVHRRYSDFGDFSIYNAAADVDAVYLESHWAPGAATIDIPIGLGTRGLTNSLLGCWLRRAGGRAALFESHWTS